MLKKSVPKRRGNELEEKMKTMLQEHKKMKLEIDKLKTEVTHVGGILEAFVGIVDDTFTLYQPWKEFDNKDYEQNRALFRLFIHMKAYFAQRSNGKRPQWPPVLDKITKKQTGIAYL